MFTRIMADGVNWAMAQLFAPGLGMSITLQAVSTLSTDLTIQRFNYLTPSSIRRSIIRNHNFPFETPLLRRKLMQPPQTRDPRLFLNAGIVMFTRIFPS